MPSIRKSEKYYEKGCKKMDKAYNLLSKHNYVYFYPVTSLYISDMAEPGTVPAWARSHVSCQSQSEIVPEDMLKGRKEIGLVNAARVTMS